MLPPLKPGVTLAQPDGPVIETGRLKLRQWRGADVAPNTAMLSDPGTARFITGDGKPVTDELVGWRNAAIMSGHWALHGFGMFVVEEKSTGKFAGRVGPWFPPNWPGFEVGWGIAARISRQGLCGGGGARGDRLVLCHFRTRPDHPLHRPGKHRLAGRGTAARRREGARVRLVRSCRRCLGDVARQMADVAGKLKRAMAWTRFGRMTHRGIV